MANESELGVSPSGPGHSAEPEPICVVSAETASVLNAALTCFGAGLDQLARSEGGWPASVVVHTMEVLRGGTESPDPQVLLEGHIPTGEKDGHATFKGCDRALSFKAVVRLSEYRSALSVSA